MVDGKLPKLQAVFFAFSNPNRIAIYEMCLKERLNITQIKDKINLSYKSVLNNIKVLEEAGLIEKNKETTDKAQEAFITSIPLNKEAVYYSVYQEIKKESHSAKN